MKAGRQIEFMRRYVKVVEGGGGLGMMLRLENNNYELYNNLNYTCLQISENSTDLLRIMCCITSVHMFAIFDNQALQRINLLSSVYVSVGHIGDYFTIDTANMTGRHCHECIACGLL